MTSPQDQINQESVGGQLIGERREVIEKPIIRDAPMTIETSEQTDNRAILLWRHPYARILLVALVLRAVWAFFVPVVPISDSNAYDVFAQNLARVAILTGALLSLWPSQIEFTTVVASELPFVTLLLVALWVWSNQTISFLREVCSLARCWLPLRT